MQEFESISASSYDPSALATKLTAKAAEGWTVVAIVPTGGDVTAFVTRDKEGDDESSKPSTDTDSAKATDTIAAVTEKSDEEERPSLMLPAKADPEPETMAEEAEPESKPEPVNEPSGWAIAPEPATPTEPTGGQPPVTIQPATTYEPTTSPGYQPSPGSTPAATSPTPAATSPTPAAAAAGPASAPAVPAGWYADPAGRFELRYWDGSTWTEHVSRTGQQFTDPPVA